MSGVTQFDKERLAKTKAKLVIYLFYGRILKSDEIIDEKWLTVIIVDSDGYCLYDA